MAANMYRVGDYVFFETSSTSPFLIRRIEELNKTQTGNVEAKVMCFYRRRDISGGLLMLADKHQSALEEEHDDKLSDKQSHQLRHRELFLSRQVETLPATHIRGKCSVALLNETESLNSYLDRDDAFFYSLVYDPTQKTLLADKGEIRVGSNFQAEIQNLLGEGDSDNRIVSELESLIYTPESPLSDIQIDQFMVIARSVGTFARALDCSSTVKQPSLHMSAAAASRDVTLFHAMNVLHLSGYDLSKAISALVPPSGPVLCRDEMEEWSAAEANLFEEAIEKYGKDFGDIRQDFLPWKSLKNIIEYYYMWKTTDRYVQQKRVKAVEAESKLKQVYIPNYNKPNPAAIQGQRNGFEGVDSRACESCFTSVSHQWYAWGASHLHCRVCANCWTYWKKYGGLKMPTRLEQAENQAAQMQMQTYKCSVLGCGKEFKMRTQLVRHCAAVHGFTMRSGSPRPIVKTRAAFCLHTTPLTRLARRVCGDMLRVRHAGRKPFEPINAAAIKAECQVRIAADKDKPLGKMVAKKRTGTDDIVARLGIDLSTGRPDVLTGGTATRESREPPVKPATVMPREDRISQRKSARPARSVTDPLQRMSEMVTGGSTGIGNLAPTIMKKRAFDHASGDGHPAKRPVLAPSPQTGQILQRPSAVYGAQRLQAMMGMGAHGFNGRDKISMNRAGKRHLLNWVEAPDDVYFHATDNTRKVRKQLTGIEMRKIARKPWRRLNVKTPGFGRSDQVVILD